MAEPVISPSPGLLFLAWLRVTSQSFGGGAAMLILMRQEFITRKGWITEAEFLRDWSLCQLAPGINLFAMSILIGKRLAGPLGIVASLAGLLIPCFTVSVALASAYSTFIHHPAVSAALKGVIPAVAGIGIATSWSMGVPIAKGLRKRGRWELGVYASLFLAGLLVSWIWHPPTIFILVGGGAFGAAFNTALARTKEAAQ